MLKRPVRLYVDPAVGRVWALEACADPLSDGDPKWCWVNTVPETDTSAAFPIGVVVVAHSLSTLVGANLNGVFGTVVGFQGDRVRVQFPDAEKALKPENLGVTWQRGPSSHMRYGDGQYRQRPVPRTPHCIQPECEHAEFNWTGLPFLTLHAHGLQLHDWNRCRFGDSFLQSMADLLGLHSRFGSQLLATFESRVRAASVHQQWSKMSCHGSKHVAFMVICRRCQRLTWAACKPESTPGHVDHEYANLLAWFQLPVPDNLTRPLETTVPMV